MTTPPIDANTKKYIDAYITEHVFGADQAHLVKDVSDLWYRVIEQRWMIVFQGIYNRLIYLGLLASFPGTADIPRQQLVIGAVGVLNTYNVWLAGAYENPEDPIEVYNRWLRNLHIALTPYSELLGEELVELGYLLPAREEAEEI